MHLHSNAVAPLGPPDAGWHRPETAGEELSAASEADRLGTWKVHVWQVVCDHFGRVWNDRFRYSSHLEAWALGTFSGCVRKALSPKAPQSEQ